MSGPTRKRRHPATSARILTAGLSSAAAFGILAGLAATKSDEAEVLAPAGAATDSAAAAPAAPSEVVVVIRRHWIPAGSEPGSPAAAPAPAPSSERVAPARPAPKSAPVPEPRTRTKGS